MSDDVKPFDEPTVAHPATVAPVVTPPVVVAPKPVAPPPLSLLEAHVDALDKRVQALETAGRAPGKSHPAPYVGASVIYGEEDSRGVKFNPAVITAVNSPDNVNLTVFFDSNPPGFRRGVSHDGPVHWHWPDEA